METLSAMWDDDWDRMERGDSRCVLSDEVHASPKVNGWQEFHIKTPSKDQFVMFKEGSKEVLLSAKYQDKKFYISQYSLTEVESGRYSAVISPNIKNTGFVLNSCSCELCDSLGKYSCGSGGDTMRQELMKIEHRNGMIKDVDVETRVVTLEIPGFVSTPDRFSDRVVWCPRTTAEGKDENKVLLKNKSLRSMNEDEEERKEGEEDEDPGQNFKIPKKNFNIKHQNSSSKIGLDTLLPYWDDAAESLVVKFHNRRVTMASSKNCLIVDANKSPVLQFGKVASDRFNLDIKFPLTPLQGFAFAICQFKFQG